MPTIAEYDWAADYRRHAADLRRQAALLIKQAEDAEQSAAEIDAQRVT